MDAKYNTLTVNKILISIFIIIVQARSAHMVRFCNKGDIDTARLPYQEECSTGRTWLTETDSSTTEEAKRNSNRTHEVHSTQNKQFCLIFQYFVNMSLGRENHLLLTNTVPKANFSCDHSRICESDGYFTKKIMNGIEGYLYCCSESDKCNQLSIMPGIPPNQQLCYFGTNAVSGRPISRILPCTNPEDWCASSTITKGNQVTRSYYCDRNRCINNGITHFNKSFSICKNVTANGQTEELCCCLHNKCNKPPWASPITTEYKVNGSHSKSNSDTKISQELTLGHEWLLMGLLIGSVLVIGTVISIWLAVLRHRRKVRAMRMNAVFMSYEEINADEVSNSETSHILNDIRI